MIKNGTRLQSQVCDTQVIVVRTADSLDDLRAGGAADGADRSTRRSRPTSRSIRRSADGNLMGKRYVDENGAEVLVTKAGNGHAVRRHDAADHQGSQATSGQRLICRRRYVRARR